MSSVVLIQMARRIQVVHNSESTPFPPVRSRCFQLIQPICKHRLVQMMFKKSKLGLGPIADQYPNPTPWERYEIAAEYYRWKGKPALFMGRLYLEAAWTARDKAVGIHPELKGPVVADQVLEQGAKELQKELTSEQRKMVTFNLARVAHRNAQFDKREQYLTAFLIGSCTRRLRTTSGTRICTVDQRS